jgi:hypothetical protein
VVDALGLVEPASDGPVPDASALLVAALRGPRRLLVLDNCEHVLDQTASLVACLVADCPRLHVLATSREPLAVPGEAQALVAPLVVDAAVQLFAERAEAVRPGFTVAENRPAVEEICRRLDGLPLAIELAAARVKALPPTEIARRLDDRFRLLRTGSRTVQPRQQTLHALIDWSYALLSEPERQVFARLAVFAGGISLDGAEAVCAAGGVNPPDVLDLVVRLVDKSLVLADYDDGGTPRFRMLETLHAYALERLGMATSGRRRTAGTPSTSPSLSRPPGRPAWTRPGRVVCAAEHRARQPARRLWLGGEPRRRPRAPDCRIRRVVLVDARPGHGGRELVARRTARAGRDTAGPDRAQPGDAGPATAGRHRAGRGGQGGAGRARRG